MVKSWQSHQDIAQMCTRLQYTVGHGQRLRRVWATISEMPLMPSSSLALDINVQHHMTKQGSGFSKPEVERIKH